VIFKFQTAGSINVWDIWYIVPFSMVGSVILNRDYTALYPRRIILVLLSAWLMLHYYPTPSVYPQACVFWRMSLSVWRSWRSSIVKWPSVNFVCLPRLREILRFVWPVLSMSLRRTTELQFLLYLYRESVPKLRYIIWRGRSYQLTVGKPERRDRIEDLGADGKLILNCILEPQDVDWIEPAQRAVQIRTLANMVMNRLPLEAGSIVVSWETISFSRTTLLHGVCDIYRT
jgi:hypothetical protein